MQTDALDEALSTFAATAPQYGRLGLSNHGPMATEVLEHLGRADVIAGWTKAYSTRLSPASPPAPQPLSEEEWPHALGEPDRFAAWLALFEREIADRPVLAVVGEWVPRLVPGSVGAAAHGLIRTAHALRALGAADTAPRRLEVANGLAFWASQYTELPGPPLLIGRQSVEEALADLPYLPDDVPEHALITDRVAHVADIADEFEQAVASLGHSGTAVALLDALAVGGARAYLRNADGGGAVALIHTITAPLATELVLPWLADEDRVAASAYAWQAVAAIHVAYDIDRSTSGSDGEPPSPDALIAAALASGDAHALKLTEAALRCYSRTGERDLLRAAADASERLRG
ncbi:MAG TPA: questin oxidase family protein [Acidimicrobiales bacterium]|nr:questin oxidase family protein [Acidimicrobiales bacterium]